MKSSLLIQSITKLLKRVKIFPAMFIGGLKSLIGTIYSIMEKIILLILISCLALSEFLVRTTVENLALLMHYSTQL